MTVHEYLSGLNRIIDAEIDRLLPPDTADPAVIHRAMRYSLFAGGKRIRPVLCITAARTVDAQVTGEVAAACPLELIHTYSLIHDDLPALDNDDLRRGKPTCHKQFGEAMAILAGDGLLTYAFQLLAQLENVDGSVKARLVEELAVASGTVGGMIAGQVKDLEGEGMEPSAELLDSIHRAKTGALLRASVRMGAIYAGAGSGELAALSRYGEHVGLAFQIVDDLLDVTESSAQLGKTAGKDAAQKKITFPAVYGIERSREMAQEQLGAALAALEPFGDCAHWLAELAHLIVSRNS